MHKSNVKVTSSLTLLRSLTSDRTIDTTFLSDSIYLRCLCYLRFINNLRDELNNVDVFLSNHIQFEKYIFIHTYRDSILLNNVEVQVKIIEEHRSSHFFINKKNVAYKCLTMAESCRFVGLISPRMPYDVSREYILLISVFQFVRLNCTYDSLM